jgi:glycosyltransferase involved in cell wall biosynthesis
MRIFYVLRSILPSQKANSVQIFNSSSALSKAGADLSLVAWNRNLRPGKSAEPGKWPLGPECYFGVENNFTLVTPREFQIGRLFGMGRRAQFMRGAVSHVKANYRAGDVVYTRHAVITNIMANEGLPVVLEMHDWKALEEESCVELMKSHPPGSSGPFLGIVAISETLKGMLVRSGVPAEFIMVAHDGIDPARFDGVMKTEAARSGLLRERFFPPEHARQMERLLKPGRPVVGYCGHFYAGRGIEMLIECARRRPEWTFLFIGGLENDVTAYREKASRLGIDNVIFTGYVSNTKLAPFLWACDVLTMPYEFAHGNSHFMSPMKMFEYMACGRAIISADWPQIREVLTDGHNALFHPRGDVDAMEKCIERAVGDTDLRESLAAQARRDVDAYTWQTRGNAIFAWLKELVMPRECPPD